MEAATPATSSPEDQPGGRTARLVIEGEPVSAKRGKPTVRGKGEGAHASIYMPKGNRVYMDDVRVAWDRAYPGFIAPQLYFERDVPVICNLAFYFPYLKSHFGTGRNAGVLKPTAPKWHIVKPDWDNLAKIVMDALAGRAFHTDNQVCVGTSMKLYDHHPRTELLLRGAAA